MIRRLFILMLLASPVFGGVKYSFDNSKLNDEWDNNYKEHSFPNIIYGRASTMTVTQLNVSSLTVSGTLTASSGTIKSSMVTGTATNDNSPAGRIGEYVSASNTSGTSFTNNQYVDLANITLTPGDWDVSLNVFVQASGATITALEIGIGTASGNSGAGLVVADNRSNAAINVSQQSLVVPAWRASISSSTTYYAKFFATSVAGTINGFCRLSARRVR